MKPLFVRTGIAAATEYLSGTPQTKGNPTTSCGPEVPDQFLQHLIPRFRLNELKLLSFILQVIQNVCRSAPRDSTTSGQSDVFEDPNRIVCIMSEGFAGHCVFCRLISIPEACRFYSS